MRYVVLVLLGIAVVGCGGSGPAGEREGLSWSRAELLAHLKAKGVVFSEAGAAIVNRREGQEAAEDDQVVAILFAPDPALAKFQADALAPNAFAWGRFAFFKTDGDRGDFFASVKSALTGSP